MYVRSYWTCDVCKHNSMTADDMDLRPGFQINPLNESSNTRKQKSLYLLNILCSVSLFKYIPVPLCSSGGILYKLEIHARHSLFTQVVATIYFQIPISIKIKKILLLFKDSCCLSGFFQQEICKNQCTKSRGYKIYHQRPQSAPILEVGMIDRASMFWTFFVF